jgi:hypothetical protein
LKKRDERALPDLLAIQKVWAKLRTLTSKVKAGESETALPFDF